MRQGMWESRSRRNTDCQCKSCCIGRRYLVRQRQGNVVHGAAAEEVVLQSHPTFMLSHPQTALMMMLLRQTWRHMASIVAIFSRVKGHYLVKSTRNATTTTSDILLLEVVRSFAEMEEIVESIVSCSDEKDLERKVSLVRKSADQIKLLCASMSKSAVNIESHIKNQKRKAEREMLKRKREAESMELQATKRQAKEAAEKVAAQKVSVTGVFMLTPEKLRELKVPELEASAAITEESRAQQMMFPKEGKEESITMLQSAFVLPEANIVTNLQPPFNKIQENVFMFGNAPNLMFAGPTPNSLSMLKVLCQGEIQWLCVNSQSFVEYLRGTRQRDTFSLEEVTTFLAESTEAAIKDMMENQDDASSGQMVSVMLVMIESKVEMAWFAQKAEMTVYVPTGWLVVEKVLIAKHATAVLAVVPKHGIKSSRIALSFDQTTTGTELSQAAESHSLFLT
eukprot:6491571-Amphidinium_carterae.2